MTMYAIAVIALIISALLPLRPKENPNHPETTTPHTPCAGNRTQAEAL